VGDSVGIALTSVAAGYWLAGSDGAAYAFGDVGHFAKPVAPARFPVAAGSIQ
jgi:hypothetical protein